MMYEATTITKAVEKAINASSELFFPFAFAFNNMIKSRTSKMQADSTSQGKIKAKEMRSPAISIF
jgi:hypothetical protein